jgi:hypothetical protein
VRSHLIVDANLIVKVTNVTGDVVVTPSVQYAAVRRANPGAPAELDATGTTGTAMFAATLATMARAVDDDLFYNDRSKYPACPS